MHTRHVTIRITAKEQIVQKSQANTSLTPGLSHASHMTTEKGTCAWAATHTTKLTNTVMQMRSISLLHLIAPTTHKEGRSL